MGCSNERSLNLAEVDSNSPCSSSAEVCFRSLRCSSARLKEGRLVMVSLLHWLEARLCQCNTWAQPEKARDHLLSGCLVFPGD